MLRYVVGRLVGTVPVLFGVTLLVFAMTVLTPGDRVVALLGDAAQGLGQAAREELRQELGLDQPLPLQYVQYVSGLVQGDLGRSARSRRPVVAEIRDRLPATVELALAGLAIAVALGVSLGVLAAVRRGSVFDSLAVAVALVGVSVPVFWMGFLLMIVFALELGWLPASGRGTWRHLVLPAVTVGVASAAFIARITRGAVIETLGQDYVRTARSKGLAERRVVLRHALRPAMLPIVTVVGLQLGGLLGGAVLTETVFAWPGVGRLLVDAIVARDLPLVQGCVLVIALLFIGVNLVVDLSYAAINPKVRYG
ncbi:MAG: ABC transporter permease [Trueperaceae bacterium]|nr:MAG: ABC transporter permease [Trueperaceae bacterium]